MKTIAILTILIIIPWAGSVLSIVALVLLFQCLTDIRNVNMKLNNASLETYRSKFSSALVLRLIIAILNIVAWFFPFNYFELINLNFNPVNASITGATFVLTIIAGAIEMGAWQSFMDFTVQSPNLFPSQIRGDMMEGGKNLKNAGLMSVLVFLFITILIGWIFQIIGYFKLANLERIGFTGTPVSEKPISESVQPQPASGTEAKTNFCPNCGAKITGQGKFCGECGSPIN